MRRKGGSRLERNNELYLAIEAFSAGDFSRLLADVGALKAVIGELGGLDQVTARNLCSGLINRWIKVDPEGTVKWLPQLYELVPKASRGMVLDALSARRPEEVLGLVSSRKERSERAEIISSALVQLAVKDYAKARAWLTTCSDPNDRKAAETALRKGLAKVDPLRAIDSAGEITDMGERREIMWIAAEQAGKVGPGMVRQMATQPLTSWMLPAVIEQFAQEDPRTALELVLKCDSEGSERGEALQTAFRALAKQDHQLAISKLDGLKGKDLNSAIEQIGSAWGQEEPEAALAWLAEKPASERNSSSAQRAGSQDSLLVVFSDWAGNAPEAARAWADALPPGEARDVVQTQRARMLAADGEVAEAARILSQTGSSADTKTLTTIASAWASRDPAAAAEWAVNQPAGQLQDKAIASVVGVWASNDPQTALAWLEQFPPGEARDRSIVAYLGRGTAFMSSRETQIAQFDQWFERIEDPWQRAQAAVRNYWVRRGQDSEAARQWLSSLQNVDPTVIRLTLLEERR